MRPSCLPLSRQGRLSRVSTSHQHVRALLETCRACAGREAPGKAYRLYTEAAFRALPSAAAPEIQRVSLSSVVLQLKQLGVRDVLSFGFMDRPPVSALLRALELLFALGALDSQGDLTEPLGKHMVRLPLEPTFAKVRMVLLSLPSALVVQCAER